MPKTALSIAGISLATLVFADAAVAQFGSAFPGFVTLPREDFTWIWGEMTERDLGRRPDFDSYGNEGGFRCRLTGRLRVSSRMTQGEIRNFEQSLSSSLAFIQASAEAMTVLDRRLELDWARLECEKPDTELSEEAAEERLDRAREKAIRDRERRRARDRD